MNRLPALVLSAILLSSCGADDGSGSSDTDAGSLLEANCVDYFDDDGDGLVDCDDPDCDNDESCRPITPKPCSSQLDCGNIVDEIVTRCCLSKPPESNEAEGALRCFAPGETDRTGKAMETSINFALVFDNTFAQSPNKPQTAVVRFIYPFKVDGSPLHCDEALTLNGRTADKRSLLDQNPAINQVFRTLYPLTWGGSNTVFRNMIASVPRGSSYILYGEAWYGIRENQNPTGNRAATYCREGVTIDAGSSGQHFELFFTQGT
jgi:hypothetical protein